MRTRVPSGRSVTFCSFLDLLSNGTIKYVAEIDGRWFIVALIILIGNKFKIFNIDQKYHEKRHQRTANAVEGVG